MNEVPQNVAAHEYQDQTELPGVQLSLLTPLVNTTGAASVRAGALQRASLEIHTAAPTGARTKTVPLCADGCASVPAVYSPSFVSMLPSLDRTLNRKNMKSIPYARSIEYLLTFTTKINQM